MCRRTKLDNNRTYSPYEIVEFVRSIHYRPEDFEEGDIVDRIYENSKYILTEIPLNKIEKVVYYIDKDIVKEYCEMSPDTMPPVVLGEPYGDESLYPIIDGGHRITTKIKLKQKKIWAYIPVA